MSHSFTSEPHQWCVPSRNGSLGSTGEQVLFQAPQRRIVPPESGCNFISVPASDVVWYRGMIQQFVRVWVLLDLFTFESWVCLLLNVSSWTSFTHYLSSTHRCFNVYVWEQFHYIQFYIDPSDILGVQCFYTGLIGLVVLLLIWIYCWKKPLEMKHLVFKED